jgi:two-component system, NtrC family, response regulator PilR
VGSDQAIRVDTRVVAATNRNLRKMSEEGRFREDLYYRLNVIQLSLPPLRERRQDIPEFCQHLLTRIAGELGRSAPALSPRALQALEAYAFPGNLRELANILERATTLSDGPVIDLELLPAHVRGDLAYALVAREAARALPPEGLDLQAYLDTIERNILEQALARTGGVKTEAARLLSLTFRSLRYRLAKFRIGGE